MFNFTRFLTQQVQLTTQFKEFKTLSWAEKKQQP